MSNKNTKNTYYSPKWISCRLDNVIDSTVDSIKCFCVDPTSNFTRSRILTPKTLIKFILGLQAHSLSGEVSDYFTSSNIDIPSISAVSQRRDLLYPEIFKSINRRFLSSIDNLSTLNGYYILAQDGSDINLPFWHDDTQISYGQDSIVCQYHLNALYDCINHVFWESRIDLPTKKSEKSALIDFINHRNYPENSIITADRGYESYNLIAHCIENNQKFVFRVKDIDTRSGIMTSISLPDETFDITVTRTLTNLQTNEVKKNENNQFVFVPSTSVFDYLDACNRFYNLSFRIVRFKIADDKYETLVLLTKYFCYYSLINEDLSFLYHYIICKKNPLSFYLLFLNKLIASFFKERLCRNGSMSSDISLNGLFQLIAEAGCNTFLLIIGVNKQTIEIACFIYVSKTYNGFIIKRNNTEMFLE